MTAVKTSARMVLAATVLSGDICVAGCAGPATETTRTTTTEQTTTMVPPAHPPQTTVTTTRTQQYTP